MRMIKTGLKALIALTVIGFILAIAMRDGEAPEGLQRPTGNDESEERSAAEDRLPRPDASEATASLLADLERSSYGKHIETVQVRGTIAVIQTSIYPHGSERKRKEAIEAAQPIAGLVTSWILGKGHEQFGVRGYQIEGQGGAIIPVKPAPILDTLD